MNFDDLVRKERIYLDEKGLHDKDMGVLVRVLLESEVLEVLLLCSNHLTLADGTFANALKHNRTLRVLNLYNNNIGVEGARGLSAALKDNYTLQQLHLGWNHIGDKGAQMVADSLAANRGLRKLWLNGNKIGDNGAHKLANALACNHVHVPDQLALEHNHISSDMKKTIKSICELMAKMGREMRSKETEIARKNEVIASKDRCIARKDEELASKDEELASKDEELASKDGELVSKEKENAVLKAALKHLHQSITDNVNRTLSADTPELISEKMEHANKRRRIGSYPEVNPHT